MHDNNDRNLFGFPSAITKMNYIISALKKAQYNVTILATGETQNRFFCYYHLKKVIIDKQQDIVYLHTFGTPFYILRLAARFWTWTQMIYYFLFKVKSNDIILVYHSPLYKWPVKIASFFKNIRLYFEVDEIYNATTYKNATKINNEINYLKNANGYILVNDLMDQLINLQHKPNIICYGDYSYKDIPEKKHNHKIIRLVYAGLIGNQQTDVFLAINAMKHLSADYQLDIAGYGHNEDIAFLKNNIDETNKLLGRTAIHFHGLLKGAAYLSLLSACDIGLCTRILPDHLSNYTFPSKVLVYLGSNLIPLCSPLTCIKKSKINESVVYCEKVNPESVADAVRTIDIANKANANILKILDNQFVLDLQRLFLS